MQKIAFFLLLLCFSLLFLSGCPYKVGALSPKYWDQSVRETIEDVDSSFGARDYP